MTDRNDPCPCGSGKKFKKCHGAGAGAQPGKAPAGRVDAPGGGAHAAIRGAAATSPHETAAITPGAPPVPASEDDKPFLVYTGRGLESERADAERKKHLRRRIQSAPMRGTLVYNSGAFFRPPNP